MNERHFLSSPLVSVSFKSIKGQRGEDRQSRTTAPVLSPHKRKVFMMSADNVAVSASTSASSLGALSNSDVCATVHMWDQYDSLYEHGRTISSEYHMFETAFRAMAKSHAEFSSSIAKALAPLKQKNSFGRFVFRFHF